MEIVLLLVGVLCRHQPISRFAVVELASQFRFEDTGDRINIRIRVLVVCLAVSFRCFICASHRRLNFRRQFSHQSLNRFTGRERVGFEFASDRNAAHEA